MAISPRAVKRRIKSVRSTGKIMKAMELVAASKMRKAVQFALTSRPYANLIRELTDELRAALIGSTHPLLRGHTMTKQKAIRTLAVVIASDRGLCGGYNSQLLKKALEFLRGRSSDVLRVATMGIRAERGIRRTGSPIVASFPSIANAIGFTAAEPLLRFVLDEYTAERVDRVFVVYTDFKSALSQIPTIMQLLPIIPEEELLTPLSEQRIDDDDVKEEEESELELPPIESSEEQDPWLDEEADPPKPGFYANLFRRSENQKEELIFGESDMLFEPSAPAVFNKLLPRLVETRLYQTLLESAASEHSARMMAMRSAGEAARDMVKDLTLVLNQARQSAITREISEISAGKAAIE
jgi:F-type H+-transporting ATPase subunit gamma